MNNTLQITGAFKIWLGMLPNRLDPTHLVEVTNSTIKFHQSPHRRVCNLVTEQTSTLEISALARGKNQRWRKSQLGNGHKPGLERKRTRIHE
jgi:hypothetical protein